MGQSARKFPDRAAADPALGAGSRAGSAAEPGSAALGDIRRAGAACGHGLAARDLRTHLPVQAHGDTRSADDRRVGSDRFSQLPAAGLCRRGGALRPAVARRADKASAHPDSPGSVVSRADPRAPPHADRHRRPAGSRRTARPRRAERSAPASAATRRCHGRRFRRACRRIDRPAAVAAARARRRAGDAGHRTRPGAGGAPAQPRAQRLCLRRLSDFQRRAAVHRQPRRALRREVPRPLRENRASRQAGAGSRTRQVSRALDDLCRGQSRCRHDGHAGRLAQALCRSLGDRPREGRRAVNAKRELYEELARQARGLLAGERDATANAANLSALIWQTLPDLNWAGFYFVKGNDLVLGPFQGRPACVRIAMGEGVCGIAAADAKTIVVADVHRFPGHIACDTASNSELVVPLLAGGQVVGVLDLDSPLFDRFDEYDAAGIEVLARIWIAAGDRL
ncbi:MAG: GAF domain-containing protein [Alphaproteobacteria bacterium]|nr:GAF domain-containing protein [Alphaproteobacteria bacterium]MDE2630040.1 GAF domain-containing protein [Alphaproteobacteria bacterium]